MFRVLDAENLQVSLAFYLSAFTGTVVFFAGFLSPSIWLFLDIVLYLDLPAENKVEQIN